MSDLEKIEELENQIKQLEKDKVKELKQWKNITTNKETYEALGFGPAEEDGVFDQWPIVRDGEHCLFYNNCIHKMYVLNRSWIAHN
mmetsp:Transcript_27584/g.42201  ORF Transcript_27584/g.42201 Transcript_27584/m.42201 type:complete len:86 (+) Transcript_27584:79-336(+)